MKNKAEREAFLKNYKPWGTPVIMAHINDTLTGLQFYEHIFRNGAKVVVTECEIKRFDGATMPQTRYNLILPQGDEFNPYDKHSGHNAAEFATYNLQGCGMGIIVDYMTKRKGEI